MKKLLFLLVAAAVAAPARAQVSPEQVQRAIDRGVQYFRKTDVFRNRARVGVGVNALVVLALRHCGVPSKDPDVIRGAQLCADRANWTDNTYHVGCVAAALAAVDAKTYRGTIRKCADWLIGAQNEDGGWRYESQGEFGKTFKAGYAEWLKRVRGNPRLRLFRETWGRRGRQQSDHSCTQFALLGLRAADEAGVLVPPETWQAAAKYLVDTQGDDGGWAYTGPGQSYGSMTAAGLGSLFICGMKLHERSKVCGEYQHNARIAAGLNWLAEHFSVTDNPGRGASYYGYYLYALERVCAFSGRRYIGKHDWYAEGAAHLVGRQRGNGSWNMGSGGGGGSSHLDTAFGLLFLGKGGASVVIQKLDYGRRWNTDHHDADHLARRISRDLRLRCTWQVVTLDDPVESWLEAPILYITGHGKLELTDEQRAKIAEFCERGGTVMADACCMNRTLDRSFRAEMAKIFPNAPLLHLPAEHPVYQAPHRIAAPKHLVWEGVTYGCRTAVFYSKRDLSCAWDGNIHDPRLSVEEGAAFRLGVNVAAYAMGYKPLKDKLEKVKEPIVPRTAGADGQVARGALVFAQLKHDGDWDPDPTATRGMLHLYAKATGARVDLTRVDLSPTDPDLYKYPLLYMTGHRKFTYEDEEVRALRKYLDRGGFLLADACCGRKPFDRAFRELMKQVFPDKELERLPPDHKAFRIRYPINEVTYRPILEEELPPGRRAPHLEAIVVDGRAVVVYSRYDFGCAFEGFPCAGCRGLELESAEKLIVNVLLYAMTE